MPDPAARTRRLEAYVAVTVAASGMLGVATWRMPSSSELARILVLALLGTLGHNLRERTVRSSVAFSFVSIVILAAVGVVGSFGAWVVGLAATIVDLGPKVQTIRRVFNAAMLSVLGALGGIAYQLTGGVVAPISSHGAPELLRTVGLPLAAAAVIVLIANAALLAGVLHMAQGAPFGQALRGILLTTGAAYIGYSTVGFVFVVLWFPANLGWASALLVLVPSLVVRWALVQYGEEVRAHERTVAALSSALAVRNPAVAKRGRAAAELARATATELGLHPNAVDAAANAALLKDIGLLSTEDLAAPGRERERARVGAHMLHGIEFLEPARDGVAHQFDRLDGAPEQHLTARIVAAASASLEHGDPLRSGQVDPAVAHAVHTVQSRLAPAVKAATDTPGEPS